MSTSAQSGDGEAFPPPSADDGQDDFPEPQGDDFPEPQNDDFPEPHNDDDDNVGVDGVANPHSDFPAVPQADDSAEKDAAAAADAVARRRQFVDRSKELRQKRRASMKVSLQLRSLNMQHGGKAAPSPRMEAQRQRRAVLDHGTANKLTVKHTGKDLDGREVNAVERRRVGAVSNAGSMLLKDAGAGGEVGTAESADATANPIGLVNEYSEQMLPDIGKGKYTYAGGKTWFRVRGTKKFFDCEKRRLAQQMPKDVEPFTGTEEDLPNDVLCLEVLRRDKERLHVATQVNKAIDMLMDKLENDDFANSVFTKETALQSRHRKAVSEEEKKDIVTKGMFHYFDNDHSNEIDAFEFAQGIRMLAQDAKRFAEHASDSDAQERAAASAASFDLLTDEELAGMFDVISGDDGIAQMDEFVAFYGSDGNVTESGKYSPKVVKTTKIVWTLLHESEDLMLQHGTLDEITAEQNLVQQTYQGMRDQATKTHRTRFPPYTNRRIPYSIMPKAYLKALAEKEARLLEEEEHYRQMLASLDEESKAMEAAVSAAAATAAAAAAAAAASAALEEERRREREAAEARKEELRKQREERLRELEAEEKRLAEIKRQQEEAAAEAARKAAEKKERRRRRRQAAQERLGEAQGALLKQNSQGLETLGSVATFVQHRLTVC